jgi:hypothetical protein
MKKRCLSCGVQFTLSGSGKRQKYCFKCARRGMGRGRGLAASKTLKTKGAEKHRSRYDNPVDLVNGRLRGKVELRKAILDAELAPPLKGFLVRLYFELEAPDIGCGQRLVLCQFRGNKVCLYHYRQDGQWMRSTTIRRDVFKDLVAANKRYRIKARRPHLKLVISNPPKFDERVSDAA